MPGPSVSKRSVGRARRIRDRHAIRRLLAGVAAGTCVLVCGLVLFAAASPASDLPVGPPSLAIGDFLRPEGTVDLERLRSTGAGGAIDLSGFRPAVASTP